MSTQQRRTLRRSRGPRRCSTGTAAWAVSAPSGALPKTSPGATPFPKGFLWGSGLRPIRSGSGPRTEGPPIWDTFALLRKVVNNATGDIADDHYHRYKEDVQLKKSLGVTTYFFGRVVPRLPQGTGVEPQASTYNRAVDELSPTTSGRSHALLDRHRRCGRGGGWESRDTSKAFADYGVRGRASLGSGSTSSRSTSSGRSPAWLQGQYAQAEAAAGSLQPDAAPCGPRAWPAVQAIRAAKPGTKVGLAEHDHLRAGA
jgi:beta-glucosidase